VKRSKAIALVMMSATPLLLTSCSRESTSEGLYTSVDACAAQTNDRASCERAFADAGRQAESNAPRYATREECVAAHGEANCKESGDSSSGHHQSYFIPMMTGFMMARMMSGNQVAGLNSTPAFQDRNGNWQRPAQTGAGPYRAGTNRMVPITNMRANAAPTVTRGGFGSGGSSRSRGG
jgi:uncharacterized protein YgiB involved in biofilm formation